MASPPSRIKGIPGLDASSNQIISPLDIATDGLLATISSRELFNPALTIATSGWIVFLTEEIVEAEEVKSGGKVGRPKRISKRKKLQKKITARVLVGERWYEQTVYTNDIKMDLKKVNVTVNMDENLKPKIKILLPEVKNG